MIIFNPLDGKAPIVARCDFCEAEYARAHTVEEVVKLRLLDAPLEGWITHAGSALLTCPACAASMPAAIEARARRLAELITTLWGGS